ncbi:MaoC family dehydratase [Corallococcus llansteffanensis]|uniref:Acyl dehydratase n=1 Tax=Corallococcus llansteffanensis TaxID=2316731 RepID=A0A3A8P2U3_9BACT|nr:MaoC/PaaZ C-terminal domain-containing protein [Corallococcus llansteffanensis]RKH50886.1 acyl dehydratase [Corallococcus llansteffanensis]
MSGTLFDLHSLPAMPAALLRAAFTRRKGHGTALPDLTLRAHGCRASPVLLERYRAACGFDADGFLPLTYPQVLATPLHLGLLGLPDFPYAVLGTVHVRNHIQQHHRLPDTAALTVACHFDGHREVPAGHEFDLHTRVEAEESGELLWQAVTTMLRRHGARKDPDAPRKDRPPDDAQAARFAASRPAPWAIPADTGRRYARASGDYNPIHLTALTARPFGFPRAIAHGMWTLARCVAELGEAAHADALRLDCDFKKPLLLPARATFQTARESAGVAFRVLSEEGKPHLLGRLG